MLLTTLQVPALIVTLQAHKRGHQKQSSLTEELDSSVFSLYPGMLVCSNSCHSAETAFACSTAKPSDDRRINTGGGSDRLGEEVASVQESCGFGRAEHAMQVQMCFALDAHWCQQMGTFCIARMLLLFSGIERL